MILNPKCSKVRRDLGNPQELHKTISKGFPEIENQEHLPKHLRETPRHKFNVLHRLEADRHRGKAVLLVQSGINPDWSFLPEDYADELKCKAVQEQYGRIENGMTLMFRLQANPTKRIGKSYRHPDEKKREEFNAKFRDDEKRRRISMNKDEDRIGWLGRKGEETGFRLTNVKVAPVPNVALAENGKINFRKERNSPNITFGSVVFEGVLQVTDAEKFREALQKGIGSGKAYGFGLLSVARSQNV
jgi:CRISPR system Cascade subunit CasE